MLLLLLTTAWPCTIDSRNLETVYFLINQIQYFRIRNPLGSDDLDCYCEGKTEFIVDILRRQGMSASALEGISSANVGFIERARAKANKK